jgi:multicomponent Na+:H+ antiporter subunit E
MLSMLMRTASYFLFWVVLAGTDAKDLVVGVISAVIAARVSHLLLPPGQLAFKPASVAAIFLRFIGQSVAAGVAVARIALDPKLPLKPGIVHYRPELPQGTRRFAFMTFASLLPGTLPAGSEDLGGIPVHCLDTGQPISAQLAKEEKILRAAFVEGTTHV